jgi:hypothetical protein
MLYIDEETRRAAQSEDAGGGWWMSLYGSWRLAAEIASMQHFPGFELRSCDGWLAWEGTLKSTYASGTRYRIRLTYPWLYPYRSPQVEILAPELDLRAPHLLGSERPCLYNPGSYARGYDPARTTAATLITWTSLWIHAYETWQQTGRWAGPED